MLVDLIIKSPEDFFITLNMSSTAEVSLEHGQAGWYQHHPANQARLGS
jgi:hypothetical protein